MAAGRSRRATRLARPGSVCDDPFPDVDGRSPAIDCLKQHMLRVARDAHVPVLILGEPGTGKERVARAIHRRSPRAAGPFLVLDGADLSFERAHGGTVFVDEVGELAPDLQLTLLRALRQRTVQRPGSGRDIPLDVRIMAATNTDLALATERGRFRQDLYYRLKVYELRLPALRRRSAADLRTLTDSILKHLSARRHRPVPTVVAAVWDLFARYSWPGNVRELQNALERMMVAAGDDPLLTPAHLPDDLASLANAAAPSIRGTTAVVPLRAVSRARPSAADALAALERNQFRRGDTAAQLGLSRHQLYRLLKGRDAPAAPPGRALA